MMKLPNKTDDFLSVVEQDFTPDVGAEPDIGSMSCKDLDTSGCQDQGQQMSTLPTMSMSTEFDRSAWATKTASISPTELRRQYSHEANCHRCMLARAKAGKAVIHPDFKDFKSFLLRMGPAPGQNVTVDRIDPADPEYSPTKTRWADKTTQSRNRQNVALIHDTRTGQTFTASELAKRQGLNLSTIHQRRKRGWTDLEIVDGRKIKPCPSNHPDHSLEPDGHVTASSSPIARFKALARYAPTEEEIDLIEKFLHRRRDPAFEDRERKRERLNAEIARFEETRKECRPGDGEPICAVFEDMVDRIDRVPPERFPGKDDPAKRAEYRRFFDKKWSNYWRSTGRYMPIDYTKLSAVQIDQIRRVDPDWIAAQEQKAKAAQAGREQL